MNMEKRFTLLLLVLLTFGFGNSAFAQCAPDSTIPNTTNYPKTWAQGCVGEPYNQVVHFSFPRDTTVVVNVTFISFEVLNMQAPPGLTYSCNISDCKWTPTNTPVSPDQIYGCMTISGTPTQTFNGQVSIEIEGCGQTFVGTQCQSDVQYFNLEIVNSASPGFTESINQNVVDFTDQTTSPNLIQIYRWDFGDGNTSLAQNPTHTYSQPGTYNVCLETQDNCGLQEFCKNITLNFVGRPEPQALDNLVISPNPAEDQMVVRGDLPIGGFVQTRLRSVVGNVVWKHQETSNGNLFERIIDVSQIAAGTYFLEIETDLGRTVRRVQVL